MRKNHSINVTFPRLHLTSCPDQSQRQIEACPIQFEEMFCRINNQQELTNQHLTIYQSTTGVVIKTNTNQEKRSYSAFQSQLFLIRQTSTPVDGLEFLSGSPHLEFYASDRRKLCNSTNRLFPRKRGWQKTGSAVSHNKNRSISNQLFRKSICSDIF